TAACVLLAGGALLSNALSGERGRTVARCLAIAVLATGGLTLLEHLTGLDLGIDTVLFDRSWGQTAATAPMRMGPPASISLSMIGAALLVATLDVRARRLTSALGTAVVAMSALSLTGYLYGAEQMYTIPRLTGIAMQTASILLALGIGLVASAPDREPMRTLL